MGSGIGTTTSKFARAGWDFTTDMHWKHEHLCESIGLVSRLKVLDVNDSLHSNRAMVGTTKERRLPTPSEFFFLSVYPKPMLLTD